SKYAEGYPGRRYYGGCEFVDVVENLAIERAKKLFGAEHVNVQPHSGSQANMAVYLTVLKPGDTILGMNLSHGGHLTHGHPLNFSGKYYRIVPYGVRKDSEIIDYDELTSLARQHKPKLIIVGASAYPRTIEFDVIAAKAVCFKEAATDEFRNYIRQVVTNARTLAARIASRKFRIVSGGTDTHLMLVDVFSKGINGKQAEQALDSAGITVNKNAIPFDQNPPLTPSGIRVGTPAVTTRGMKEAEMEAIGDWIVDVLDHINDESVQKRVRREVETLCERFPLYRSEERR